MDRYKTFYQPSVIPPSRVVRVRETALLWDLLRRDWASAGQGTFRQPCRNESSQLPLPIPHRLAPLSRVLALPTRPPPLLGDDPLNSRLQDLQRRLLRCPRLTPTHCTSLLRQLAAVAPPSPSPHPPGQHLRSAHLSVPSSNHSSRAVYQHYPLFRYRSSRQ